MDNNAILKHRESFQQEQDQLLYTLLDSRFFDPWRDPNYHGRPHSILPKGSLELFITPVCNQKCEYCYLQKYSELYPIETATRENILKNLRIILDWVVENRFYLPNIDLFGGEIWHTPFGLEVLDTVYEYVSTKGMPLPFITIPTNGTFIQYPNQVIEIQNRIDRFKRYGCNVLISFSTDGKYIELQERPRNDNSLKEEQLDKFYDDLFTFVKHNNYGFHPMLAAKSAKHWIKNFNWWLTMIRKFDLPLDSLMLLEVRNDDWEEEDIQYYEEFVKYLVDLTWDYHNGDFYQFVDDILLLNQVYEVKDLLWKEGTSYMPNSFGDAKGVYGCTLQTHLTVRLGDLAIAPCHRTAYNKYLYGHFQLDENGEKITGIKANNPQVAVNLYLLDNKYAIIGCDTCIFNPICMGTCRGQSIEANQDIFQNDPKVCNFLKRKYTCLFKLIEEKGVMTWLSENLTIHHSSYDVFYKLIQVWEKIKEEEKTNELAELRQNIYRQCEDSAYN